MESEGRTLTYEKPELWEAMRLQSFSAILSEASDGELRHAVQ